MTARLVVLEGGGWTFEGLRSFWDNFNVTWMYFNLSSLKYVISLENFDEFQFLLMSLNNFKEKF